MKNLFAMAVGTAPLLTAGAAFAQSGSMMDGGMGSYGWMGGYGGAWGPILLVIVVAGLVTWIVRRGGK